MIIKNKSKSFKPWNKRQEWWDEDYIQNKIVEVGKKYNKDNYRIISDMMTYEESIDRCQD